MRDGRVVWVVVPAFDEERLIDRTLDSIPAFVDRVVVVDDASSDGTAARVAAREESRTLLIRRARNGGVGAAIADGYRAFLNADGAGRDACVVMAGDAQMDAKDLPELLAALTPGTGYAKGNRFLHPDVRRAMPPLRYAGNRVFSILTRWATGLAHVGDSQCGYAAVTRDALRAIDLDRLYPRYGFPNDLLVKLAAADVSVRDVRVRPVYGDETSRINPWKVVPRILRLLWRGRREVLRAAAERRDAALHAHDVVSAGSG